MTALMDAVAAATATVPRLYAIGSVPASPTYPYGVYAASMGRGDSYTLDSAHGVRWLRATVQTFGRTAASALDHAEKVANALLDQRLEVNYTPLRMELDPAVVRDPDDQGVIGVTTTLTATRSRNA